MTGRSLSLEPIGEWVERAACHDKPLEMFFPVASKGQRQVDRIKEARGICLGCPVSVECNGYVMGLPRKDRYGVWAGVYYTGGWDKGG